jgi:hypothetical protein
MLTPNRYGSNPMIKIRKKNYLFEKNQKINIDNELKTGGIRSKKNIDEIWRGRTKELYDDPQSEQNYQLNQIIKKYKSNKDELKGYDYKYILELTDLLAKKDNNFTKKRLELYNRRINSKKNLNKLEVDKSLSQLYRNANHFNQKPKLQGDKLNKNPLSFMNFISGNNKNYNTFYKGRNKNNISFNNQNNQEYYYKTSYNYNSPLRIKSLKYQLSDTKTKSWGKDLIKKNNNINTGILITQFNHKVEDDFDSTSLVGKEDFFISRDKEKYHEYLNKQFNFFNQPKLIQIKYLYEKQKRIKLFKKMPNAKYLFLKKEDPLKTEIFKRINREKNNIYLDVLKNMGKNNNTKKNERLKNKSFNKGRFYKECKNIMMNVKKNLKI